MKLYALAFVLCFAVVVHANSELKEKMKKLHEECQKETGAPADLLVKLEKGEYTGDGADLKCYPKCFFVKAGFMSESGEINVAAMKEIVKDDPAKDKLVEIIDHCSEHHESAGKDACDVAFKGFKCYKDHMKEMHLEH